MARKMKSMDGNTAAALPDCIRKYLINVKIFILN